MLPTSQRSSGDLSPSSTVIMSDAHSGDFNKEKKQETEYQHHEDSEDSDKNNDDGGYGWIVVLGAFLSMFTVFGAMNSWGEHLGADSGSRDGCVILNFYVHHGQLEGMTTPKSTAFALSLIGATTSFVSGFFAPLVRVLEANWGFRRTILLGICLVSGGLIASGWAHQVWHLYLSQSLCFGLGYSIFFLVISKTVPEWFSRRRTTAMGIVMSSGGLGGLTFPFVITPLNETLGVSWTFRILGAAFFGINLLASFLVKPKPQKSLPSTATLASVPSIKSFSSMIRFKLLKANVNLSLWCIAAFLQVVYMNIPLYFLPSYATQLGLSTTQGSSLVSITAGATFIGRLTVGALADRIGNMNACMIFSVISGAACFCIWTVAYDYATLIGFAVVFGLFGGSYLTTMPPIVQYIVPEQFPEGLALVTFVTSPAYAGPSVASSLENISQWEPFLVYKVFCGSVCIASALLILALKIRIHGRHLLAKV